MNEWMQPNEINSVGEAGPVDLADVLLNQHGRYRYALNDLARTLVVEIDIDGNGNCQGGVFIYLSDGISGTYWRRVACGKQRIMAMPSTKFINIIPQAGSQGWMRIQMLKQSLPPATYSL